MKTVLITGCSSGFGYNSALKFARNGHIVFAGVRNKVSEGAKKLQDVVNAENLPITLIEIDVTSDESVRNGISEIMNKTDHIDVLVNNAGFGSWGPVEEFEIEEVQKQYDTNILGVLRMVKAVAPIMRRQKSGNIINLSSISGLVTFPLYGIYSSSKHAIEAISDGLRFDLSHFGVSVSMIEPGSFMTNFSKSRLEPEALKHGVSEYKELIDNFNARYEKTHSKSKSGLTSKVLEPTPVVDLIYKVATTKNPAPRYMIGNDAFMFSFAKKFLPWQVWEWLLHRTYRW